mgnify:FL=1
MYADKQEFSKVASIWNTGKVSGIRVNGIEDRLQKQKKNRKMAEVNNSLTTFYKKISKKYIKGNLVYNISIIKY